MLCVRHRRRSLLTRCGRGRGGLGCGGIAERDGGAADESEMVCIFETQIEIESRVVGLVSELDGGHRYAELG